MSAIILFSKEKFKFSLSSVGQLHYLTFGNDLNQQKSELVMTLVMMSSFKCVCNVTITGAVQKIMPICNYRLEENHSNKLVTLQLRLKSQEENELVWNNCQSLILTDETVDFLGNFFRNYKRSSNSLLIKNVFLPS